MFLIPWGKRQASVCLSVLSSLASKSADVLLPFSSLSMTSIVFVADIRCGAPEATSPLSCALVWLRSRLPNFQASLGLLGIIFVVKWKTSTSSSWGIVKLKLNYGYGEGSSLRTASNSRQACNRFDGVPYLVRLAIASTFISKIDNEVF